MLITIIHLHFDASVTIDACFREFRVLCSILDTASNLVYNLGINTANQYLDISTWIFVDANFETLHWSPIFLVASKKGRIFSIPTRKPSVKMNKCSR